MKIFGFFFGGGGGHYEIGLFFFILFLFFFFFLGGGGGSFLYIIGRFKVKVQNRNIFLGRKFSNIFGYT